MTPQQFVGIGVRLFAIWLALVGINSFGSYFAVLDQPGLKESGEFLLLVPVLYCLSAAALWLFPMMVAHQLVPKTRFENVLSVVPLEMARVGTALLGLWLLATSTPWLASLLVRVIAFKAGGTSFFSTMSSDMRFYLLEETLRIVIGLLFVFASARIAQRILVVTSAGNEDRSSDL